MYLQNLKQHATFNRETMGSGIHSNEAAQKSQTDRVRFLNKTILFFAVLSVSIATTFAQDIITLKNGNEIKARIQEVGDVDMKYKKFDSSNESVYTLLKTEIAMIKYENGSTEMFSATENAIASMPTDQINIESYEGELLLYSENKMKIYTETGILLSKNEVRDLMKNVPAALEHYNSGLNRRAIALGLYIPGLAMLCGSLGIAIQNLAAPKDGGWLVCLGLLGGGLTLGIPAIFIYNSGAKRVRRSLDDYNNAIKQNYTPNVSLNFGITQSGSIGLTLIF